jgi:hypothetical protein
MAPEGKWRPLPETAPQQHSALCDLLCPPAKCLSSSCTKPDCMRGFFPPCSATMSSKTAHGADAAPNPLSYKIIGHLGKLLARSTSASKSEARDVREIDPPLMLTGPNTWLTKARIACFGAPAFKLRTCKVLFKLQGINAGCFPSLRAWSLLESLQRSNNTSNCLAATMPCCLDCLTVHQA